MRPIHRYEGRFYVELISKQALARHMEHQDFTNRSLAQKIGRSPATVAHLRRGGPKNRTTTSSETAKRIEKALGLPPCTLFLPKVEPVTRSTNARAA